MTGSYKQIYVGCPFYRYDDARKRIVCEGITDECSIVLAFQTKEAQAQQMDIFCCNRYICCEVYRMLMGKYDEGGD